MFASILVFSTFIGTNNGCYAQQASQEKALSADFFPEPGCPVQLTALRSVLEIDPFGAPMASKIYLTYTNNSSKPVSAVKFRCRYSDNAGKDCGTFHAPDAYLVPPGASRSHKWKREGGLHPRIAQFQIRVLQVKYDDGSMWVSERMKELSSSDNGEMSDDSSSPPQTKQPNQNPSLPSQVFDQSATPTQPQQSSYDQTQGQPQQTQPGQENQQNQTGQGSYDKSKELPW
ncbi:MAG: hypothetical protein K2X93_10985 [Candidatus Obscuribacterales bacterium]|nr:hypothetical protein [Candidatus Obscuribacterales bacterium]